jgi:hypothetical protein
MRNLLLIIQDYDSFTYNTYYNLIKFIGEKDIKISFYYLTHTNTLSLTKKIINNKYDIVYGHIIEIELLKKIIYTIDNIPKYKPKIVLTQSIKNENNILSRLVSYIISNIKSYIPNFIKVEKELTPQKFGKMLQKYINDHVPKNDEYNIQIKNNKIVDIYCLLDKNYTIEVSPYYNFTSNFNIKDQLLYGIIKKRTHYYKGFSDTKTITTLDEYVYKYKLDNKKKICPYWLGEFKVAKIYGNVFCFEIKNDLKLLILTETKSYKHLMTLSNNTSHDIYNTFINLFPIITGLHIKNDKLEYITFENAIEYLKNITNILPFVAINNILSKLDMYDKNKSCGRLSYIDIDNVFCHIIYELLTSISLDNYFDGYILPETLASHNRPHIFHSEIILFQPEKNIRLIA